LEIIRKAGRHVTTNEIRSKLKQDYNIIISWVTLNKYIENLEKAGHITGIKVESKNTIRLWITKGDTNAEAPA
jgi:hypothetical protein